jgi:hypothetical protein
MGKIRHLSQENGTDVKVGIRKNYGTNSTMNIETVARERKIQELQ